MVDVDRVDELQEQVDRLQEELASVRRQLAAAELDQWRGRIDDLEVQAALGSMSVRDRLGPVIEELRNTWLDARARAGEGTETASEVTDRLRDGMERAMSEIRNAVRDARTALSD
jgi:predicted  nucleic acid-binding Zn-ribbon protein